MRKEIINIIVAVLSVVVIMAVATLLFLNSGMNTTLLAAIIGIPLIFIIIGVLYIASVKRRRLEDLSLIHI